MERKRLCFLLLLFISYTNCYGKEIIGNESINKDFQGKQNGDIKDINISVQTTEENLSMFDKIESDIMNESTQGGILTGYFNGQYFVKFTACYFGEIGMLIRDYYLNNNKLTFVNDKEQLYDKSIYDGKVKVVKINIVKYYIQNNQINVIFDDKNNILNKNQSESNKMLKEFLQDVKEFTTKLNAEYKKSGINKKGSSPK